MNRKKLRSSLNRKLKENRVKKCESSNRKTVKNSISKQSRISIHSPAKLYAWFIKYSNKKKKSLLKIHKRRREKLESCT